MSLVILTCEHGGHDVPPTCAGLFTEAAAALTSPLGWDAGALELARQLEQELPAHRLFYSTTTRLLADLNRAPTNVKELFSDFTRELPETLRRMILEQWYHPYRREIADEVQCQIAAGENILHFSIHSFAPVLDGEMRNGDIGLIYDTRRKSERALADRLEVALKQADPSWRVRRNFPHAGASDSVAATLRKAHPEAVFRGMEIEISQLHALGPKARWAAFRRKFCSAVSEALRG